MFSVFWFCAYVIIFDIEVGGATVPRAREAERVLLSDHVNHVERGNCQSVCLGFLSISWRNKIYHSAVCFWEIWRTLNKSWERGMWSLNENQVYNRKIRCNIFYSALPCGHMDGFFPRESMSWNILVADVKQNVAPSWIFSLALSIWSTDVLQIIFIVRLR